MACGVGNHRLQSSGKWLVAKRLKKHKNQVRAAGTQPDSHLEGNYCCAWLGNYA